MLDRRSILLLTILVPLIMSAQKAQPKYQQGAPSQQPPAASKKPSAAPQKPNHYTSTVQFGGGDRDTVRTCMAGTYGKLPPGTNQRPLPPALDAQIRLNAPLPSGLRNRVQPLPELCDSRLVALPVGWSRVLAGRRVLLLDANQHVVDTLSLD